MSFDINSNHVRLPAEWEPVDGILVAWPNAETDWNYILPEVEKTYIHIVTAISAYAKVIVIGPSLPADELFPPECNIANVIKVKLDINDTWIRDYGPLTLEKKDGSFVFADFCFNGWGMKFASNNDNQVTYRLFNKGFLEGSLLNKRNLVLEGGSIESDGRGLILTTACCLTAPNRNDTLSQYELETEILHTLGARKMLWLNHGSLLGDDTDGHIDTLARLLPPGNLVAFTGCEDPADPHFNTLNAMKEELSRFTDIYGCDLNLVELPLPDPIYDPEDNSRLPATYANFLFVNGAIILPTYNQPLKDAQAAEALKEALPEYQIVPVDCTALIRQHGSLHCATMQLPAGSLKSQGHNLIG